MYRSYTDYWRDIKMNVKNLRLFYNLRVIWIHILTSHVNSETTSASISMCGGVSIILCEKKWNDHWRSLNFLQFFFIILVYALNLFIIIRYCHWGSYRYCLDVFWLTWFISSISLCYQGWTNPIYRNELLIFLHVHMFFEHHDVCRYW